MDETQQVCNMKKFKSRFNTDRLKERGTKQMYCEAVRRRFVENRVEEGDVVESCGRFIGRHTSQRRRSLVFKKARANPGTASIRGR